MNDSFIHSDITTHNSTDKNRKEGGVFSKTETVKESVVVEK